MYKDIDEAIEIIKKHNNCNNETAKNCLANECEVCEHNYDGAEFRKILMQIPEWLEELKALREKAKGDKWYQQGRADAINAIKNDLHGKLVEEQNKPYPDGSLCLGYYNSIKICDWYLNDNKECEE